MLLDIRVHNERSFRPTQSPKNDSLCDKYSYFLNIFSVRVSNELGRGNSKSAKFSIVNVVITSFVIGFVLCICFLIFRGKLAYIFTDSDEVAAAVAELSPLLACSILLNSIQPVLSGKINCLLSFPFMAKRNLIKMIRNSCVLLSYST